MKASQKRYRAQLLVDMQADPLHRQHGTVLGRSSGCRCEVCVDGARWKHIKRRYGLSKQEYLARLAEQGGVCAICGGGPCAETGSDAVLHLDHDHACCSGGRSCGKCLRGFLCGECNRGIGKFHDDPDRLVAAATYVIRYRDVLAL